MNQAQQLKEKIEKMEKGLSNPNIQGAAREALETSLGKAKAQLAEMEETKAPTPSKPNKVYKKDFYAAMDKKYPGLTQAQVRAMKQDEYEQLQDSLGKHAIEMGVPEKDAVEYADAYLGVHLPKGFRILSKKTSAPEPVNSSMPNSIRLKQVRILPYTLSPIDKNLEKILRSFISKDKLRKNLNIVHFEKDGVVASDALKLIRIKGETTEQGDFCITKKCFENLDSDDKVKFPNYRPQGDFWKGGEKTVIELIPLLKVTQLFIDEFKGKSTIIEVVLRLQIKEKFVFIDAKQLKEVLKSLIATGEEKLSLNIFSEKEAIVFYPAKNTKPSLDDDILVILAPLDVNNKVKEQWKINLSTGSINRSATKQTNTTIQAIDEEYVIKTIKSKPSSPKVNQANTKNANPAYSYSWRKKEDVKTLAPVVLHCQHYSLKVEKDISVRLKGNGNESIEVMVKTGEYLIFDDKGYLVFVMNANSFQRKCNENTSLENHEALKHKAAKTEQLEKEVQKLKAEIAKKEIATKKPTQSKKPQPSAKTPKAKPAKKTPPTPKPASKKRHKCTVEELSTAQLLAKVMKFVEQNTIVWNDIFSSKKWKKSQEIEGIYEMKGDNAGKVIVKIRDWSTKAKKDQVKWYILCIDSFKLTKIEAPGQNTYKRIISKRQLQAAYTTKGEHKYKRCATLYSEMAKCRVKGNCTTEQKERFSKRIGTCGNLGKRKVAVPTFIKYLHAETRKRRKIGENYGEALSRTAEEMKKAG